MRAFSSQIANTFTAPFGMVMEARGYTASGNEKYRYGMNSQEKDNEIFEGAYSAEYWEYDGRLGRRWNIDPVVKDYESSYACFENNPIWIVDPDGSDSTVYVNFKVFKDKIANDPTNKGYDIDKLYEYEKSKFVSQLEDIYRLNGVHLNVVETTESYENVEKKLDRSDMYMQFDHLPDGTQGYTSGNRSVISVGGIMSSPISNNHTMWLANIAAHETFHGFIQRFGATTNVDEGGHTNSTLNIMMKGAQRTSQGSGVEVDELPVKGTDDYRKYLLIKNHKTLIQAVIKQDISTRLKKGVAGPKYLKSQDKIKHHEIKRINY